MKAHLKKKLQDKENGSVEMLIYFPVLQLYFKTL